VRPHFIKLLRDQSWLSGAHGKAVKIVAPLVCSLPTGCRYRVILIERDYGEILDSQAAMIRRRGERCGIPAGAATACAGSMRA